MSNEGETVETLEPADGEAADDDRGGVVALERLLSEARECLRNCVDALKVLEVDPIALAGDGEDREDLLRAAEARGRAMVQHGRQLVLSETAVREDTIRKALGGALDEEKSLVDTARRVARDLKLAQERPVAAVVDDKAEMVRAKLGGMLYFSGDVETGGPSWLNILSAVEWWSKALGGIAYRVGMEVKAGDIRAMRNTNAVDVYTAVCDKIDGLEAKLKDAPDAGPRADRFRPTIDPDDEGVVDADVTALKRVSDNTVKLTLELVWPEDVQNLTLGRAWLRCNASDDIPL